MTPVVVTDVPKDQVGDTVEQMLFDDPSPTRITVVKQANGLYTVTGFFA